MLGSFAGAVLIARFGVRIMVTAGCTAAAGGMLLLAGAIPNSSVFAAVIGPRSCWVPAWRSSSPE